MYLKSTNERNIQYSDFEQLFLKKVVILSNIYLNEASYPTKSFFTTLT